VKQLRIAIGGALHQANHALDAPAPYPIPATD
jgi:hypothetical protein